MNWERAKTILICLFLAVDLFLLAILLHARFTATRLTDRTVRETVSVLKAHQIELEETAIPTRRAKNQNVVLRNYFEKPERIADKFFGRYETLQSDATTHVYCYQQQARTLSVKGTSFIYQNEKMSIAPFTDKVISRAEHESLNKQALERLKKMGFAKKTLSICEGEFHDGLYECKVIPLYSGYRIYGISMHLTMDSEDILSLEGVWFNAVATEEGEEDRLLDVTSVLSSLIFQSENSQTTIHAVENAFYVDQAYLDNREVTAMPIYIIEGERQTVGRKSVRRLFNARNGAEILSESTVFADTGQPGEAVQQAEALEKLEENVVAAEEAPQTVETETESVG